MGILALRGHWRAIDGRYVDVLARPLVAFHQEVFHQVVWQSQKVVEYHSDGEFLPEKFQFDARSEFYIDGMVPKRHENLDDLDSTDGDTDDDRDTDDRAEAESRRLDAMTLDAINCSDPFKMAHVGPGSNPGPRPCRFGSPSELPLGCHFLGALVPGAGLAPRPIVERRGGPSCACQR